MTAGRVAPVAVLLVAGIGLWYATRHRAPATPPPTAERIEALRAERDGLESRLNDVLITHGEASLAGAPQAGVMIGIPTAVTSSIVDQVVTGIFGETILTLHDIKAHAQGDVKAKVLFSTSTLGTFDLQILIHEATGNLTPGRPWLDFGKGVVSVALPVHLASGRGDATLHLKWNGHGVADSVCGDIDVTRKVGGTIVPHDYSVKGRFLVSAVGDSIVLRPEFPDLVVRMFIDPSEQAWAVVDGIVRERPKGCEIALSKLDLKKKLSGVLGKGFRVKIPSKILKPVTLPAGVQQSLRIQGLQLALDVKPVGLLVAGDRIWYGADLHVTVDRAAARRPSR
jgi:hypothetical protein